MAKALLGHVGYPLAVETELAQLRARVATLNDEVERLKAANELLTLMVADTERVEELLEPAAG